MSVFCFFFFCLIFFFFFKQKTAYEIPLRLVGSEMCIRDRSSLTGGADDLFAKQKPRGFEAFMQKVTVVLGIIFFVVALALAWYSSK
ncbi:preprotein translocase subunit SecG [Lactobacillus plantarum JDM1] [Lactiplantibacillus mudanjiangensis]|nr:preprotein translocase subunit SecG [Lactobacillus plantarum JDM1] [Lactiplantibacillus mudanjiangensis]